MHLKELELARVSTDTASALLPVGLILLERLHSTGNQNYLNAAVTKCVGAIECGFIGKNSHLTKI